MALTDPLLAKKQPMSASLVYHLRRLEKLQKDCGVAQEKTEDAVDTSKMSPYQAGQYKVASQLKNVRDDIKDLDSLPENSTQTQKTMLAQGIRRGLQGLKKDMTEVKKLAQAEDKKSEYQELMGHVTKTEELYKARFRRGDSEADSLATPGSTRTEIELSDLNQPFVSMRDDEEFVQFFEQTKQMDVKIDQAVDRITVGVSRLHDQALNIKGELKVQNQLLDETEQKVDKVQTNLVTLNKRLKKTLKEVDKDKMCLYIFCCLLLLGIAGAIYFMAKGDD